MMPTQPKLLNISCSVGHWLRLRYGTAVISSVLSTKWSTAHSIVATSSSPALYRPSVREASMPACSSVPVPNMATQAIAGLAMRLVQRLDVRHEPISPSLAAASVAAAGPCSSSSR
ncbi:MAG TPA: hypothetical protein VFG86_00385, partial [Chloroflexota bacterium]|nr:hypothetical protein [Chloroflexota bacterium]